MLEIEKEIYNTYLKTSRGLLNKPYTIRKDFSKFESNPQYVYISKISNLLRKLPHIKLVDYFTAPYKVYSNDNENVYTLEFYATLKAIGCYKQYMKLKEMEPPDSTEQLQFIADSFRFIAKFCTEYKISIDQYLDYKIGFTPEWMKHYSDKKISIYSLLDFSNIYDRILGVEEDYRKILLGDLDERFYTIKTAYTNSTKARPLVKKALSLLRNKKTNNS